MSKDYYTEESPNIFACNRCDKKYRTKKRVLQHFRLIHIRSTAAARCKICNEGFRGNYYQLMIHKKEKHGGPKHVCGACGKEFRRDATLKVHIRSFHLLEKNFSCEHCDLSFFKESRLKNHMVKHSKERRFACKFCKKTFQRKSNLDFHERIHTGDKRKVCGKCGEAFVQKASLNYHMVKYHPEAV